MAGFPSSWISQSIASQNASFAQNNYLAQQMSMPVPQAAGMGGMPGGMMPMAPGGAPMAPPPPPVMAPPPPSSMTMRDHFRADRGGMMGESMAAGMASFGSNIAAPIAGGALAMAGLDPFSLSLRAGMGGFSAMGGGAAGLIGGAGAAAGVALPLYAGYKLAQTYGSAFTGGMQDQVALNATLRNNFQFLGGQRGQGFTQRQMGAIGGVVQNELDQNMFTSANELNSLIAQGAQGGMFTGVRDVGEFSRKFSNMIDTLKTVQRELGGSLQEAMDFVQQAKNSGIFNRLDRQNLATQVREVTQMTGMSREDAMMMAAQGAQIARQAGGTGAQGAFGAMRMGRQLGSAITTGAIDESMLSEATGGLTGTAAIQAFSQQMMQRTARFSRRPMGRFSLFAMADPTNAGRLDQGAMAQFLAGDLSVGDVSRRAHRNVNQMGRAQALNREGELRGAMLEQGGLAGQIGMMRLMLGDRVMNQGDDVSQLVMRRRFGMSRQEAEIMQSLMRNQGSIAEQESMDRAASARSARREEVRRERSFDAVMDRIGHEIEHGLGVHEVRQMGRNFVTKLSDAGQRVMDRMLGIYTQEMSNATRTAVDRAAVGQMRGSDIRHMQGLESVAGRIGDQGFDPFQQGIMARLGGQQSLGSRLEAMGYNISGYGGGRGGRITREFLGGSGRLSDDEMRQRTLAALSEIRMGQAGIAGPEHQAELQQMLGNRNATNASMISARIQARGMGGVENTMAVLQERGVSRQAAMAYMARQGMTIPGTQGSMDLSQVGGGRGGGGMFGIRDEDRQVSGTTRAAVGGLLGGPVGAALGLGASEVLADLNLIGTTSRERSLSFLASGGHRAAAMRDFRERVREGMGRGQGMARFQGERMNAYEAMERAQQAAAGMAVDEEALDALTQEDEIRRLTLRMANGGPDARRALEELQTRANAADPSSERGRALDSMAQQARDSIRRHGRVGREFVGAVMSPQAREDAAAAMREMENRAVSFTASAGAIEDILGENETSEAFRRASTAFAGGDAVAANGAIRGEIDRLSRMDPEERASAISAMSSFEGEGSETIRAVAQMAANRGQLRRALRGEGRRGRRQALETAQQVFGGVGMGRDFEIEVGGRTISGRRAQRLVERTLRGGAVDAVRAGGGSETDRAVISAMSRQFQGMNISREARGEIFQALQQQAQARTPEERAAAEERIMGLRDTYREDFERVQSQQTEQAMERLRQRDPLGAERNRLLQRIADNTSNGSEGENSGATSGGDGE